MRILVIGSGGREHALVHTFHRQGHTVHCIPGNPGTGRLSEPLSEEWKNANFRDFSLIAAFVEKEKIDLTVVGSEEFLAKGIADYFIERNLLLFGPTQQAALFESSKVWAKAFMTRYAIPTARYRVCLSLDEAQETIRRDFDIHKGVVVKPSGLTGGKGVVCCDSLEEAQSALSAIFDGQLFGSAGAEVLIEEKLVGRELSLLAFCDGSHIVTMIPSQDHKRLNDQEQGPNTGGMGAYAPVPFVTDAMMQEIQKDVVDKTLKGILQEKISYKGVLYFGLMLTDKGPRVLEYNCRFGDPEAQVVLPLLESDLAAVMTDCCQGRLQPSGIKWKSQAACCVVMTSKGYPESYQTGDQILGLETYDSLHDYFVFHAGTKIDEKERLVTAGGRVLGVTGIGTSLQEATKKAYQAVEGIEFPFAHYRKDIAQQGIG